jgi:MoxR-like ATPase
VLATQNPIEYEGTFPLPEAQLDRFLMRIELGYPSRNDEIEMLDRQQQVHPLETLAQAVDARELIEAQTAIRTVYVDRLIKEYILSIVEATRKHDDVYLGASPRGSLALYRTAQGHAAIDGRDFVIPDDVKTLAAATLAHRIILRPAARIKNIDARTIIDDILRRLPVPGVRAGAPKSTAHPA